MIGGAIFASFCAGRLIETAPPRDAPHAHLQSPRICSCCEHVLADGVIGFALATCTGAGALLAGPLMAALFVPARIPSLPEGLVTGGIAAGSGEGSAGGKG